MEYERWGKGGNGVLGLKKVMFFCDLAKRYGKYEQRLRKYWER